MGRFGSVDFSGERWKKRLRHTQVRWLVWFSPVSGGLGGLRSGGEKLGPCQGHSGSLPYWWLQSTGKVAWERQEALLGCHGLWVHWLILALCVFVCVGVSVIAANGLISASCGWSAWLFKTCAFYPCCQIVWMLRPCLAWCSSSRFLFFVFLDFVFEFWTLYVSGEHTATAHLRLYAAKSDCNPAQAWA